MSLPSILVLQRRLIVFEPLTFVLDRRNAKKAKAEESKRLPDPTQHRTGAALAKKQHRAVLSLPELRGLRPHPVATKTTAPRIPMWSPTMVLTERHSG